MYIKIAKVRDVELPKRANYGDALDFFVPNDFNDGKVFILEVNHNILIPSGIKAEVPFGFAMLAVNKSGVAAKKELLIGACLIDHGYAGEIHIDLHNVGSTPQTIQAGDKVAQIIVIPVQVPQIIEVRAEDLYSNIALVSNRGAGGFGSTGVKAA